MYQKNPNFKRTQEKNPALRIRDFYSFGLQVLNEINFARMHPDEFLQKLEELLSTISDSDNCLYVDGVPFFYTDLKHSLEQAIDFLSKQKPLQGLVYNKTITQACDYLLDELIIHDGLEESANPKYNLENRLSKFGQPLGECYELIDYGMFDPEFIVINFILCDGDNQKYERNVIFNPSIKYLGIASSILPSEKICTVINFCEEFYDKYEGIPLEVQMKYKKTVPKYNTKTNKSFLNQKENIGNINDINDIDNEMDNYNIKRRDSGKLFSMKRKEYIQRRDSLNKNENQEIPNKKEPKMMEIIEEEKIENEEPFDREFKIESSKKSQIFSLKFPNIKIKISVISQNILTIIIILIIIAIKLNNFKTNNVTDMSGMFYGCPSLKQLNLNNFNTNNVTNMSFMFSGCSSLKQLNLNNFNTNNVTDMNSMSSYCSSLKQLNLNNFNTNNVFNMNSMFYGCSNELIIKIKIQYKNIKEEAFWK